MSEIFCTRCLAPEDQIFALLSGETVELPGLGPIRNPHLTECCKEGWDTLPKRGEPRFRIALSDVQGRPAFVSKGIARVTPAGTPYARDFQSARLWTDRRGAEQWIREHPLERGLRPRIEELDYVA